MLSRVLREVLAGAPGGGAAAHAVFRFRAVALVLRKEVRLLRKVRRTAFPGVLAVVG